MTSSSELNSPGSGDGLFQELADNSQEQALLVRGQAKVRQTQGSPRLRQPKRKQVELRAQDLESVLGEDHRARLVWGNVERQDLSVLIEAVEAGGSNAGRAAIDPRILFALWLYATLQGMGSGRELARLSDEHDAYRWICGGVSVNYHALNDFRSGNAELMDELLTTNVASLAAAGAITLERVAQDGMRVRASAGAVSLRREASLREHLQEAQELVQTLKEQAELDPWPGQCRAQAAKQRVGRERQERIEEALKQLPEVAEVKKRNKEGPGARGAGEHDARRCAGDEMGDGGLRPAYNVQFATTCQEQVIVGMDVVNAGSDMAQMAPMVQQVEQRLGQSPEQWLVDGGFPAHEQLDARHRCTQRCPSPGRRRTNKASRCRRTSTSPRRATARRWRSGASAWPASRPRRPTSSARPRPNA